MSGPAVAVVGASTAGAAAAYALRSAGHEGPVLLFGAEKLPPYERPPLSKDVLTSEAEPEPLWLLPAETYAAQDIQLHTGARVDRVVRGAQGFSLQLADREEAHAEIVVLATGARARRLPWMPTDEPRVCVLRSWDDAVRLRSRLRAAQRVLVVGSGLIGAECAASAAALGAEVVVAEAADRPFPGLASAQVRAALLTEHHDRGVDIRPGISVEGCHGTDDAIEVQFSDGVRAEFDLVVVGVGVVPDVDLAVGLGARADRGIEVDGQFRTSVPDVYAIGDVATRRVGDALVRHEHFASAQAQGEAAARAIAGHAETALPAPWAWSDQFSRRLEVLGDPGSGDEYRIRRAVDGGLVEFSLAASSLVGVTALDSPRLVRDARRLLGGKLRVPADQLECPDIALKNVIGAR